ncbi:MAG: hypothetical protein JWO13_1713 [Acidobacteriales bacterium]|nr:hypothetical protein [Terriglobales bacterium]
MGATFTVGAFSEKESPKEGGSIAAPTRASAIPDLNLR